MKCASCGRDNVDDARYCAHCGARQPVPTPIAAVAAAATAAMSRGSARIQAANAAHAEPDATALAGARATSATPDAWPGSATGCDGLPNGAPDEQVSPSSAPAYDATPRRRGLAIALAGGCVLAAIAAFAGWRMLHGDAASRTASAKSETDASVMSTFPPEDTPHRTGTPVAVAPALAPATRPVEPTPNAERTDASKPQAQSNAGEAGPQAGGVVAPAAQPAPPVEIKALPARPAHAAPSRRAAVDKRTPPPAPAPAPRAPEPASAPARAAAPSAPAAATPLVPDRWARMKDDLSRCTREDFIARVICDQRVRWRYCDGYWGKVVQCPANPTPESGR